MWRENRVWLHFNNDILASNSFSADFLASYLRFMRINKDYTSYLEVIDLQKYKLISGSQKVQTAIRERLHIPFVFITGKN